MQQYTILCFVMPFTALNVCTTPINTSNRRQFVYKDILHQSLRSAETTPASTRVITPGNMTCESKRYPNGTISTCVNATGLGRGRFSRNSDLNNKQIIVNIENNLTPEFNIHIDNPPDGMESPNIVCKKIEGLINGPNKTVTQIISCRQNTTSCEGPNCKNIEKPKSPQNRGSSPSEFSTTPHQPDGSTNTIHSTHIDGKRSTEIPGSSNKPTDPHLTSTLHTLSTPQELVGSSATPTGTQSTGNSLNPDEPQKSTGSTDTSVKSNTKSPGTSNVPSSTDATQEIPPTKQPCITKPGNTISTSGTLNTVTESLPTGKPKSYMSTRPTDSSPNPSTGSTQDLPPTRNPCITKPGTIISTSGTLKTVNKSPPTGTSKSYMSTRPTDSSKNTGSTQDLPPTRNPCITKPVTIISTSGSLNTVTESHPTGKPKSYMSTRPTDSSKNTGSTQDLPPTRNPCITKPVTIISTSGSLNTVTESHPTGKPKSYMSTRPTDSSPNPSTGSTQDLPPTRNPCITKPGTIISTSGTLKTVNKSPPTGTSKSYMSTRPTDTGKNPESKSDSTSLPLHATQDSLPTRDPCITKPGTVTSTSGTSNSVSTNHPSGTPKSYMSTRPTETNKKPDCIIHPSKSSYPLSSTDAPQDLLPTRNPCITKPGTIFSTSGTLNTVTVSESPPTGSPKSYMSTRSIATGKNTGSKYHSSGLTDTTPSGATKENQLIKKPCKPSIYPIPKSTKTDYSTSVSITNPTSLGESHMSTKPNTKPICITHPPEPLSSSQTPPPASTPIISLLKKPCVTKPGSITITKDIISTRGTSNSVSINSHSRSTEPISKGKISCATKPSYTVSSSISPGSIPFTTPTRKICKDRNCKQFTGRIYQQTLSKKNCTIVSKPEYSSTNINTVSSLAGMISSTSMPSGSVCFKTCQDECRQKCMHP